MTHYCRHCSSPLEFSVIDLGHQPPSNAYLTEASLLLAEVTYPMNVYLCTNCWLVQLPEHASANTLFDENYAYFSSTSSSWCSHSRRFAENAIAHFGLTENSFVIEIASNDGYLLQYFNQHGVPSLGIEPTHSTAVAAREKGVNTLEEFFGTKVAQALPKADLVIANNVLAHVPDINNFLKGISIVLKPTGKVSIEFPHLLQLLINNQFDTIYHEHYSYLSLSVVKRIAHTVGLVVIDVEELTTHGGSLRVWLSHESQSDSVNSRVEDVIQKESDASLETTLPYKGFQDRAKSIKLDLLRFLISSHERNELVVGYGAAAKGNTLLNYSGVSTDLLPCVADKSKSKQHKYLPGSHIPVVTPEFMNNQNPDKILILPWNLADELKAQMPDRHLITFVPYFRSI